MVFNHKFNDRISLSFTWVFGTGNAITLAQQYIPQHGIYQGYSNPYKYYGGTRNSYRMAPYHRADVNLAFSKQKKKGIRTWNISVYNLYNRLNPFYIETESTWDQPIGTTRYVQYSLFPLIPSFSYSYAF